jgi:hypothetical protein
MIECIGYRFYDVLGWKMGNAKDTYNVGLGVTITSVAIFCISFFSIYYSKNFWEKETRKLKDKEENAHMVTGVGIMCLTGWSFCCTTLGFWNLSSRIAEVFIKGVKHVIF